MNIITSIEEWDEGTTLIVFVVIMIVLAVACSFLTEIPSTNRCKRLCEEYGGFYVMYDRGYRSEQQCICKFRNEVKDIYD